MRRPTLPCLRCGKTEQVSFRHLCRTCGNTCARAGTLEQWPAVTKHEQRTLAEFATEFATLDKAGRTYMQICRQLGYSTANRGSVLRVLVIRAQKKGLLPRGRPRCGWRPTVAELG